MLPLYTRKKSKSRASTFKNTMPSSPLNLSYLRKSKNLRLIWTKRIPSWLMIIFWTTWTSSESKRGRLMTSKITFLSKATSQKWKGLSLSTGFLKYTTNTRCFLKPSSLLSRWSTNISVSRRLLWENYSW